MAQGIRAEICFNHCAHSKRSAYIVDVFFFFGEVGVGEAPRCSVSVASFSAAALRFSLIWPGT
jgi:hypothetical protein